MAFSFLFKCRFSPQNLWHIPKQHLVANRDKKRTDPVPSLRVQTLLATEALKTCPGLPNQCFVRLATSHQQPEGHFHNSGTLGASGMSLLHSALQSLQYVRCGLECQKCVIAHNAQITNSQRLRLFFGVYELLFTVI